MQEEIQQIKEELNLGPNESRREELRANLETKTRELARLDQIALETLYQAREMESSPQQHLDQERVRQQAELRAQREIRDSMRNQIEELLRDNNRLKDRIINLRRPPSV